MTARRFDPARNREEIAALYGAEHEAHQINWPAVIQQALVRSPDNRDLRDAKKIGQRLLRKAGKRV